MPGKINNDGRGSRNAARYGARMAPSQVAVQRVPQKYEGPFEGIG
jgi:hypothetical protein